MSDDQYLFPNGNRPATKKIPVYLPAMSDIPLSETPTGNNGYSFSHICGEKIATPVVKYQDVHLVRCRRCKKLIDLNCPRCYKCGQAFASLESLRHHLPCRDGGA